MARPRRLEAALRRLRRGGDVPEPASAPPVQRPEAPDATQLTLGELSASRREAAAVRLRALRERAPAQPPSPPPPPGPAAPTGQGAGPATPGPDGSGPGWRERLLTALDGARLWLADGAAAAGQRWYELPSIARQRIAAVAIVVAVAAIVVWVLIPAAPCGAPGGNSCPPEDDAIALVPADALAYVHLDVDADGAQPAAASAYAERLPLLSGLLVGSISEVADMRVDFNSQIAPWAGDEIAVAVLPELPATASVTMIETADPDAAQRFAAGLIGPTRSERVGGLSVALGAHGSAAALLDGFLLIGDLAGVRAMIDGDDRGNLDSAAAATGIDELPDDRFAYAYLSGDGARALLARDRGLVGLDALINSRASSAVTAALSFEGGLASLTIRSAQDPDLAAAHPSPLSMLAPFEPALDADVGPDALAYLGLGDPAAAEALPAWARRRAPMLKRAEGDLHDAGLAAVTDQLLPLLGGEAALSIEPVAGPGAAPTPGVLAPAGVPYASLLAAGVDADAAAAKLADLQRPLAAALAPDGGEFEPLQIAGVEAQSLAVSSSVVLTYATYDDRLVVATKPVGIAQARAGGDGLADSDDYRAVTSGMPAEVSALAYLDLRDLLSLGEQIGLAEDSAYARLAPDLRTLQAAALSVTDSGTELRTDIRVALGEPPDAAAPGAD